MLQPSLESFYWRERRSHLRTKINNAETTTTHSERVRMRIKNLIHPHFLSIHLHPPLDTLHPYSFKDCIIPRRGRRPLSPDLSPSSPYKYGCDDAMESTTASSSSSFGPGCVLAIENERRGV